MRRAVWPLVVSIVVVGVLFLAVFPTRTYLGQRQQLAAAQRRLAVLAQENEDLAARVQRLNTDAEIERLAREQYNLVRPGEEAYAILPAPAPPAPDEPRDGGREGGKALWARLVDAVVFWR